MIEVGELILIEDEKNNYRFGRIYPLREVGKRQV